VLASKLREMAPTRKRAPSSDRRSAGRAPGAPARAPAVRRGASARARRRRRPRGVRALLSWRAPRLPALDQRGRDVLGLGLVAGGVFMGFVLYGSGGAPASWNADIVCFVYSNTALTSCV